MYVTVMGHSVVPLAHSVQDKSAKILAKFCNFSSLKSLFRLGSPGQVKMLLFRRLRPCGRGQITTVHRDCWPPARLCALTTLFHSLI